MPFCKGQNLGVCQSPYSKVPPPHQMSFWVVISEPQRHLIGRKLEYFFKKAPKMLFFRNLKQKFFYVLSTLYFTLPWFLWTPKTQSVFHFCFQFHEQRVYWNSWCIRAKASYLRRRGATQTQTTFKNIALTPDFQSQTTFECAESLLPTPPEHTGPSLPNDIWKCNSTTPPGGRPRPNDI